MPPPTITYLAKKSVLLRSNAEALEKFAKNINDAYIPLASIDFEQIKILNSEDAESIWLEDPVPEAHRLSVQAGNRKQKNPWAAFQEALAVTPQTTTLPHRFLSRMEQMRPLLFPHRRVLRFDMSYPRKIDGILMTTSGRFLPDDQNVRMGTLFVEDYEYLWDWLQQLPLEPSELVYVARSPEVTLVMPWRIFVRHWDVFYTDGWVSLNVVNDDPEWYLFLHNEMIALWGCTDDYGERHQPMAWGDDEAGIS